MDNRYLYTLSNKTEKKPEGFYIMDIQNYIKYKEVTNYFLDHSIVGENGVVDFSADNERLINLVNYELIKVVPPLHRNVINFMGMDRRENYISCKKNQDVFIALSKNNVLSSWNIMNGKLIKRKTLTN